MPNITPTALSSNGTSLPAMLNKRRSVVMPKNSIRNGLLNDQATGTSTGRKMYKFRKNSLAIQGSDYFS